MLSSDAQTYAAIQMLQESAEKVPRPIVFWIGAGASAWAGFPLWNDLTARMHSNFVRSVPKYEKLLAAEALTDGALPTVFQYMKDADTDKYYRDLVQVFGPASTTEVYARMVRSLEKMQPLYILTTNVDESLERSLPSTVTVQSSDIERINTLIHLKQSFVCKLHGTSSAVESMVFADEDYLNLINNEHYLLAIQELFSVATVVFVGYSLRDDYIIKMLLQNEKNHPLFGGGPHFLITANDNPTIPESVKRIRYASEFTDHRDALLALEVLANASSSTTGGAGPSKSILLNEKKRPASAYYLADLLPPFGQVQTSQTVIYEGLDGHSRGQIVVGDGYVQSEINISNYSALHDLVVGLLCFDCVYFAANRISIVHNLLGSVFFWELVKAEALKVVDVEEDACVRFSDENSLVGEMLDITLGDRENTEDPAAAIPLERTIRQHLSAAPGYEDVAIEQFSLLAKTAVHLSSKNLKSTFSEQTRSALVNPSMRKLLGMSRGTPYQAVPRWLAFPAIRLARVMTIGAVCRQIEASAARMILGVERLATAAFASAAGKGWADDTASYVLTGHSNSDLGALVSRTPGLLQRIVEFRSSQQGEAFRIELAECLQTDKGAQIAAAVNSGMKRALSESIVEQARNQFSGLFLSGEVTTLMPAVWGNLQNGEARIEKWKDVSRGHLQAAIRKHGRTPYSMCPCGSGEQLKFCCMEALGLRSVH